MKNLEDSPGTRVPGEFPRLVRTANGDRPSDPEFTGLIALARQGDESAWFALVGEYEPRLQKIAYKMLGRNLRQEVDGADLVQLVHWSLWKGLRLGKFDLARRECLFALSYKILRHKVSRLWRNLERKRRLASGAAVTASWRDDQNPEVAPAGDPGCRVLADDEFERLSRILTKAECRLIELKLQGYNTSEAARLLGKDPNTVRVALKRLREKARSRGFGPPRPAARSHAEAAGGGPALAI